MLVILVAGIGLIPKEYYEAAQVLARAMETVCTHHSAIAASIAFHGFGLRVILAFEVFAVVQALGGTLFPVLMSETYAYQFELLNGSAAAAVALIILGISIASTIVILRVLRVQKERRSDDYGIFCTSGSSAHRSLCLCNCGILALRMGVGPTVSVVREHSVIPEAVNSFPKAYVPEFNFESIEFFMEFAGMTSALGIRSKWPH